MNIKPKRQKKIVIQFEKEIKEIERQIKYYKFNQIGNKISRKLKLYSKTIQKFIPCMIVTGFSIILIKSISEKAFTNKFIDNTNEPKKDKNFSTMLNKGSSNTSLKNMTFLYKYKKIESDNENKYKITLYKVNEEQENIAKYVITNKTINLNQILETPLCEYILEPTEKQQFNENHYTLVSYQQNENGEIVLKQFSTDSIIDTIIKIIVISGTSTVLNLELIKRIMTNQSKSNNLDEINNNNLDVLQKKLIIKQNNYNKLIGDDNE